MFKIVLSATLIAATSLIEGCSPPSRADVDSYNAHETAGVLRRAILSQDVPAIMALYCGPDENRGYWLEILAGTSDKSALVFESSKSGKVPLVRLPAARILEGSPKSHIYYLERRETRRRPAIGDHVMVMYYPLATVSQIETEFGGIPEWVLDENGKTVLLTELMMGHSGWCWDDLFGNIRGLD